jgi:hypothetical protein
MGDPHLLHCETAFGGCPWNPCASRDDLAVVVEWIEENNREVTPALHAALLIHDARGFQYSTLWLLTCSPRIIAEACLEVLEG